MHRTLSAICSIFLLATIAAMAPIARAGTLENLERERAITVRTIIEPGLEIEQRASKLEAARQRLVDL